MALTNLLSLILTLGLTTTPGCRVGIESSVSDAPSVDKASSIDMPDEKSVRTAIERSLPFIERGGVSCHRVSFMVWSHHEAARHAIEVDQEKLGMWSDWAVEKLRDSTNFDGMDQVVLGRDARQKADRALHELLGNVHRAQQADGSFPPAGQLPDQRRPQRETIAVSTMWALLATHSLAANDEAEFEVQDRALRWLASLEAGQSNETRVLRLLVEDAFGNAAEIPRLRSELLEHQNSDGGWAWLDGESSDAFATGQNLYALSIVGSEDDQDAVVRAKRFLVSTQTSDGSWRVSSTIGKHRSDVMASYWGTAWATIGLARSLPEPVSSASL